MFNLDPLSRPTAIIEILLLLAFAAFIGWLLARLILNSRINTLRSAIADQELQLDDCRRSKLPAPPKTNPVSSYATPAMPEPVSKLPVVMPGPELAEPDIITTGTLADEASLALAPEHPFTDPFPPPIRPVVAGGSEAVVLQRIAARAGELNFDRIGLASAAEADDLKDIVGIGPFLERKLHSLGIYTFRQVANFEKEDVDKVNEIIEFFPGRIERDNWVDQAKLFYERKYGKSQ